MRNLFQAALKQMCGKNRFRGFEIEGLARRGGGYTPFGPFGTFGTFGIKAAFKRLNGF
jgi:hypothetical protein